MANLIDQTVAAILAEAVTIAEADQAQILAAAAAENVTLEKLVTNFVTTELNSLSPLLKAIVTPTIQPAVTSYLATLVTQAGTEEAALFNLLIAQANAEVKVLAAS